jgi:hypothetical protein
MVTNLTEIVRFTNRTSAHAATVLINTWLARYPKPTTCIYDQGSEFIGWAFQHMLEQYNIQHQPTTVAPSALEVVCDVSVCQKEHVNMITNKNRPALENIDSSLCALNYGKQLPNESPRKRVRFGETAIATTCSETSKKTKSSPYVFYFVPKGTDMAVTYIEGDTSTKGLPHHVEEQGIATQQTFCKEVPLTHFVISD